MEIPVSSREWIPAWSIPEWAMTQIKAIMAKSHLNAAAVKSIGGTCYMGFMQNGRIYYGMSR